MRSKIGKQVRASFTRTLMEDLPQFTPVQGNEGGRPGNLLFKWKVSKYMNCYIYLQISARPHEDSFTIELACSPNEYPFGHVGGDPSAVSKEGAVRFRLPQLYYDEWRPTTVWEPWWWIGPQQSAKETLARITKRIASGKLPQKDEGALPIDEALPLVGPQVQDAIDRIKRFGVPFFQKFVDAKGQSQE